MEERVTRLCLILMVILGSSFALAGDFYVPGQYPSIQSAIDAAQNGDTVIVDPNTYYENINFNGKAITVRSTDPDDPNVVSATIINGSQPDDPNCASVVTFNSGEGNDSVLEGFTITGGTGTWLPVSWWRPSQNQYEILWNRCGGGVICYNGSSPTIAKNVFCDNITGQGGGIYFYDHSDPIIIHNTFVNNSAITSHGFEPPDTNYPKGDHADGGAIVGFEYCNAVITDNLMQNNYAGAYGGAIHLRQWSDGLIANNHIVGNDGLLGGGIHITYMASPDIVNNLIESNIGRVLGGGGIYVFYHSDPMVEGNLIRQNDSPFGAGIGVYSESNPVIRNNLITANINGSGILCKNYSAPLITHNTITANVTKIGGGGICCSPSAVPVIENNIISSNSIGHGIYVSFDSQPIVRYNNVFGNESGNYGGQLYDQTGINGNISVDPLFVDPNNGDYHLQSNGWRWDTSRNRWHYDDTTSRCVDAGDPGYPLGDELLTVPDDPDGLWGVNLRVNIGAFGGTEEASIGPYGWSLQADITNNGIVDLKDFSFFAEYWLQSAMIEFDLNRDAVIDFSDVSILVNEWLNRTCWY